MHDLDRALQEFESAVDALESGEFEFESDEFEFEADGEFESGSDSEFEFESDTEFEFEFESGSDAEFEAYDEAVFDEVEEMELAASLLEVQDEFELDQFLGKLIRKASRAAHRALRNPVGKALGGVLKNVARKALPVAGGLIGNIGIPGVGGAMGGQLAARAGKLLGLEMEGMSPQDQEFEIARRVVRLSGAATKLAAQGGASSNPVQAAKDAVLQAAAAHAPGLVAGTNGRAAATPAAARNGGRTYGRSGRWYRRGRRIILVGI